MSGAIVGVMARSAWHTVKKQAIEHPYVIPLFAFVGAQSAMGIFVSGWTLARKADVVVARWDHLDRTEAIDFTNPRQQKLFSFKKEKESYQPRGEAMQELYDIIYADGEYNK